MTSLVEPAAALRYRLRVMKVERASKKDFEKRAAEKAKARGALDRAVASGKVSQ